jgi:hypothetical protein
LGSGFGALCMREALWRIVVDTKYGNSWGRVTENIRWGCGEFFGHTRFEEGDASKIRF